MPILLSILLLHNQVRYLRSMTPWPAQPVYSLHICYSTWRPILVLKHTSNLWDLFTGTAYFARTRLSEYGETSRVSLCTTIGVWGFPAFSLGDTKRFQASQFSQPRRLDWFCTFNIFRTTWAQTLWNISDEKVQSASQLPSFKRLEGLQNRWGVACKHICT